jgi:predicted helicase
MKAERNTKPSAAETKPNGWPDGNEYIVGMWVSVIRTSIRPRRASSSQRRCGACGIRENQ